MAVNDGEPLLIAFYLLSGAFAMLVCALAARIGPWLGVMDVPDGRRKLHRLPTPLVGGLSVLIPVVVALAWFSITSNFAPLYLMIGAATLLLAFLGFLDDRRHVRAVWRLIVSAAVFGAVLLVVPGLTVRWLNFSFAGVVSPVFLGPVGGFLFVTVCLVGLQNAVNMADGKNGLVIGLCLIWTIVLFGYVPSHLDPLLFVLVIGLAVAFGFNVAGRIFLGDAGTYGLSALIGLLTIYTYNVGFVAFPADAVALMFLLPVVDTLRLMVARLAKGRSPFSSDRDHLHHILLELMPWHWALSVYLVLVALPLILSRYYVEWTGLFAVGAILVYSVLVAQKYRPTAAATSNSGSGLN